MLPSVHSAPHPEIHSLEHSPESEFMASLCSQGVKGPRQREKAESCPVPHLPNLPMASGPSKAEPPASQCFPEPRSKSTLHPGDGSALPHSLQVCHIPSVPASLLQPLQASDHLHITALDHPALPLPLRFLLSTFLMQEEETVLQTPSFYSSPGSTSS